MKLPRAAEAVVPREKIENYLLNLAHPVGGGKARFFHIFGFSRARWSDLAGALRQHAVQSVVTDQINNADGTMFVLEGSLETPSGRRPVVRSVWLAGRDGLAPRLITAYPRLT